ncbi:antibiotic biosynthesis monooxygenase [Rubellimicrobium rubrum]|uniref:Antibiotic biosynthesis monooxygenase n=1 Tax=Rubellimicrobium rubrum TaxID=2585369 RepID=A0A5C4MRJ1_9RHOB|nr:antibiotic biosynthesis monooxygenase [Rubellimicrobium rubrum]TNC48567.1 antibiotic biosynthesis monooxygenase [Rubellimicrobium rubrum]
MIIEYIRYQAEPARAQAIVEAYRVAAAHLRAAPECLSQEVAVCEEDASAVTVRLIWSSTDGHLQGFRRGAHFPPFLALVRPFVSDIAEMRHYRPVALD